MQNSQPGVEAARLGYGKRPAVAKGSNAGESISHKSRMARALFFRPYAPLMNDPRAVRKLASSYDRRNNVPLAKFSRLSATTWDENVTSVLCDGDVFHGFTVNRLGVFIDEDNFTGTPVVKKFAGRIVKHGRYDVPRLGVLTLSQRSGNSYNFFERGPFGVLDGRVVRALSDRTVYCLYESGNMKASAVVHASGRCTYNDEICAPHHPPFLAIIAQVGPVEVRPATAAPSPGLATLSRRSNRGFALGLPPAGARDSCRQRGTLPRRTPSLVGVRHSPIAAALQSASTHCARLCSIHIPLGLAGRGSRGQPATARGGARAPGATQCGGMSRGLLKDAMNSHSLARMAYSRGYLLRHGTVRSKDWAATIGSTRASVPPSRMT